MTDELRPGQANDHTVEDENEEVLKDKRIPYLIVYIGNDRGKQFALNSFPVSIGRSDDADVMLNDEKISRIHCVIKQFGDLYTAEDNGSTNGTFVEGEKITSSRLEPGASIQVGRTVMKFDYKYKSELEFETKVLNTAINDPLTGIFNREGFSQRAQEEIALAKRTGVSLSLLMIDIDNFKEINDTFGHLAGDYVLSGLVALISEQKRTEDLIGRYGGDEFLVLLRGLKEGKGAVAFSNRIREQVADSDFVYDGRRMPVTVSIGGMYELGEKIHTLTSLIEKADKALYKAKNAGKNRVEFLEII